MRYFGFDFVGLQRPDQLRFDELLYPLEKLIHRAELRSIDGIVWEPRTHIPVLIMHGNDQRFRPAVRRLVDRLSGISPTGVASGAIELVTVRGAIAHDLRSERRIELGVSYGC